jgi:MoaA/NifB/PqqE/SkfB family radical SAM enzyme
LKIIIRNIHSIYKVLQTCYGHINTLLPDKLKLTPLVLRIRITNKCNLHCGFCYLSGNLNIGEENHLTLDEWKIIIDKLPPWTIIDITGAEPFLSKNFKEILTLLLDKKLKISITTNGYFLDKDIIDLMVKRKLYYLMISVDGMEKYHNEIRGHEKSFQQIQKFITTVETAKTKYGSRLPHICVKSTITNNNMDEIVKLNDFIFEKYNIHSHSLNLMFQNQARGGIVLEKNLTSDKFSQGNTFQYDDTAKEVIKTKLTSLINRAKSLDRPLNIKPTVKADEVSSYIDNPASFGVKGCNRYNSIQTIYFDGSITPCDIGFKLGDIRDLNYNLSKTWSLKLFKKFKKYFFQESPYVSACDACCLADQSIKND